MTIRKFLSILIISTSLMACTRSNDNPNNTTNTTTTPQPTGVWKVTLSIDNGDGNITSRFNPYTFNFTTSSTTSGTISSVANGATVNGSWSTRRSDDNGGSTKLTFTFSSLSDDQIKRIDGNWQVVEATATTLKLKDDNPASNEKLEFTKQ